MSSKDRVLWNPDWNWTYSGRFFGCRLTKLQSVPLLASCGMLRLPEEQRTVARVRNPKLRCSIRDAILCVKRRDYLLHHCNFELGPPKSHNQTRTWPGFSNMIKVFLIPNFFKDVHCNSAKVPFKNYLLRQKGLAPIYQYIGGLIVNDNV